MKKSIMLALSILAFLNCMARIKLPALVGDNMVLQQSSIVNIWGWATPLKSVTIKPSWGKTSYLAKADDKGRWLVKVPTPTAGGPFNIIVSDGEPVVIKNVLIGEVWICSGQSNMEMPVHGFYGQSVNGGLHEILEAKQYPAIRMFTVPPTPADTLQEDCRGSWLESTPESVRDFSAVGYFFGKTLNRVLNVPVGLITPNCGATAIESWMTAESIKELPGINQQIAFTPQSQSKAGIPASLYNGMIAPVSNYTSKGFIWYQGESNRHNYFDYDKLMPAMVSLWRKAWQNEQMPFYYVQLVPFEYEGISKTSLPLAIEAQYKALKAIPNAAIAATTDLGHQTRIHPPRKKEIGWRLASLALLHTYKVSGLLPDAPVVDSTIFTGETAVVTFKGVPEFSPAATGSIDFYNGDVKGFEMAGTDKKFYPAKVKLIWGQNKIEVTCEQVKAPVALRYAFKNYHDANVMTTEGQPLPPFRTDNWNDIY